MPNGENIITSEKNREIQLPVSLRDYFAAKAMQGMLSADLKQDITVSRIAQWAYQQADAMLAEREKETKP